MMDEIQNSIVEFIVDQYEMSEDQILYEENLTDQGIIDSFAFVEIAVFLEKKYFVKIENEEITAENFATLASISAMVERKICSK
jgi:acyl carrier protein